MRGVGFGFWDLEFLWGLGFGIWSFFILRRHLIHLARHKIFVLVADPIAIARDAPDEVQLVLLAKNGMIIQERNGYRVAFTNRAHETFALFVSIDFHRAAAFGEDVNLLLIGMIVRRPGTLMGLENSIAG